MRHRSSTRACCGRCLHGSPSRNEGLHDLTEVLVGFFRRTVTNSAQGRDVHFVERRRRCTANAWILADQHDALRRVARSDEARLRNVGVPISQEDWIGTLVTCLTSHDPRDLSRKLDSIDRDSHRKLPTDRRSGHVAAFPLSPVPDPRTGCWRRALGSAEGVLCWLLPDPRPRLFLAPSPSPR